MKTSASQFDLLVTYMEQHGDLSKPSSNARGRIASIKHWEELASMLNSDGSGEIKSTEKWKKVWSDYKNNTKKKAARLHRAASGTGGGPAVFAKLTDLEQRVLSLVGVQVATGLAVEEAGVSQEINIQAIASPNRGLEPEVLKSISISTDPQPASAVTTQPLPPPLRPLPLTFIEEEIQNPLVWEEPQPSTSGLTPMPQSPRARSSTAPPQSYMEFQMEEIRTPSPRRASPQVHVTLPANSEPAQSWQTTPRRVRPTHPRRSPRRRPRPTNTDLATQHFLQSEESWRKFKAQQHKDYMDLKREQLESQRQWQALGSRALDLLDKLINKYCKD